MKPSDDTAGTERIGLCADCRHMRRVETDRRAVFYRCLLSDSDTRFPKYPRLPVLQCPGYRPLGQSSGAGR